MNVSLELQGAVDSCRMTTVLVTQVVNSDTNGQSMLFQ